MVSDLPKPLTESEEQFLLQKKAEGATDVDAILVERNLRLVLHIAKKFENSKIALEDLFSQGTIGLLKAVRTYSPNKNTALSTYASRCIENEILMLFRKNKKSVVEISIHEPLREDSSGNRLLLENILVDEKQNFMEEHIENEEALQVLSFILNDLNKKKKVIILYSLSNMTQAEISLRLNVSQSYVSRINNAAKKEICTRYNCSKQQQQLYTISSDEENYLLYIEKYKINDIDELYAIIQKEDLSIAIKEVENRYLIKIPKDECAYHVLAIIVNYIEC